MHNLGSVIKLLRLEKGIKQVDLCKGICTPSYLSRIENNRMIADIEIYSHLFEKLGLDYEDILNDEINSFNKIEEWYNNLLSNKSSNIDIEQLRKIAIAAGGEEYLKFQIVYCRYQLQNNKLEEAEKLIKYLKKIVQVGHNRNFFIYSNVLLLFHFLKKNYDEETRAGLDLILLKGFETLGEDYEIGIFYFNLAYCYLNLYLYDRSIYYAKKALSIFNDNYYFNRAIDCQILLGIGYNNSGFFEESVKSYKRAIRLLNFIPKKEQRRYLSNIYNNLGYCYEIATDYREAIQYYKKGLSFNNINEKLRTYVNLTRSYYNLKDYTRASHYLQLGIHIKDKLPLNEQQLQLDIFSLLLRKNIPIKEIINIQKTSIDYFMNNKLWGLTADYSLLFANLYEQHRHYRRANQMYKIAYYSKEQQIHK